MLHDNILKKQIWLTVNWGWFKGTV